MFLGCIMEEANKQTKGIFNTYFKKWVVVVFTEGKNTSTIKGIIVECDTNFIKVKGTYTEKIINTKNIDSIKLSGGSNGY